MTQLDLPQISLQRYLDLLRRRRWQVIPVSLLGLLIGGFVALLIPRYYVAETVISYTRVPGETKAGPLEDPMSDAVDAAKLTIPMAVGDTIKQLGWDDYPGLGSYAAVEYEAGVRSRIEIHDQNAGKQLRSFAQIQITYRDQDGQRAASFLNGLVRVWIGRQLQKMRENTQAQLTNANERAAAAMQAFATTSGDITNLERQNGLSLFGLSLMDWGVVRTQTEAQIQRQEKTVADLQTTRRNFAAELEGLRQQLDATQRKVPPALVVAVPGSVDSLVQEKARLLFFTISALEARIDRLGPAHESLDNLTKELEDARKQQLLLLGADAANEVVNPLWRDLNGKVTAKARDLEHLDQDVRAADDQLKALVERQQRMAQVFEKLRSLGVTLDDARKGREAVQAEVDSLQKTLGLLNNTRPIDVTREAMPPPRPTEPNVLVVAILGCLIGLGAAIGLILLVDILQGTFKTVEDVERAMPVPVLGGFAHLETEEVRQKVRSNRRTASLVGGTVLVLVLAVVTIYYIDPTRLPAFARNVLALVLG